MKLLTRIFFIILITPALSYAAGSGGMNPNRESDNTAYNKEQGSKNYTSTTTNKKTTAKPAATPTTKTGETKTEAEKKEGSKKKFGSKIRDKISDIKEKSAQKRIERKEKKAIEENNGDVVEDTENDDTESDKELTNEQQLAKVAETDTESVKEAQEKKVAELQENYDNMKEIENSFENRMLGATGIASMGMGGMQLASAISEDRADDAAEQQMKAYLATFSCTYANGKRFSGGETAIELPGGNELINLYSEYVGLANDLKTRKEALNLRPGIEAQPILDSATSGLYDDIATGKTTGAFTSLARALSDPNSADAAAWAAQREETAKQKKTALTTIGVGAVATVAGNLLINRNNEKERSAEILEKYEDLKKELTKISTELNNIPSQGCPDGSEGNPCTCKDENSILTADNVCTPCGEDKKPSNGECVCSDDNKEKDELGNCVDTCEIKDPKLKAANSCTCINNATKNADNICQCNTGYIEEDSSCISTKTYLNTKMAEFSTDNAFDFGSNTLTQKAQAAISDQRATIEKALKSYAGQKFCLQIIGHTDRTGFSTCYGATECDKEKNKYLSEQRAKTVLEELKLAKNENVIAIGKGQEECDETNHPKPNDDKCRRITFELVEEACTK